MENLTQTGFSKMEIYWLTYQVVQRQVRVSGLLGPAVWPWHQGPRSSPTLCIQALASSRDWFLPSLSTVLRALPVPSNRRENWLLVLSYEQEKTSLKFFGNILIHHMSAPEPVTVQGIWRPLKQSGPPWAEFNSPHWTGGVEWIDGIPSPVALRHCPPESLGNLKTINSQAAL